MTADQFWYGVAIHIPYCPPEKRTSVVRCWDGRAALEAALSVARDAQEERGLSDVLSRIASQVLTPVVGQDGGDLLWSLGALMPQSEVTIVDHLYADPDWLPTMEAAVAREVWLAVEKYGKAEPGWCAMSAGTKLSDVGITSSVRCEITPAVSRRLEFHFNSTLARNLEGRRVELSLTTRWVSYPLSHRVQRIHPSTAANRLTVNSAT